jgi:hypothetical protein
MLSGYKAKIGGVGLMLSGLGAVAAAVAAESIDWQGVLAGAALFCNGLGVFGIRVALDKVQEAVK